MSSTALHPPTGLDIARYGRATAPEYRGPEIERIIHLAAGMFLERGYDNVTFDDVARASGVPRRSLYRRFRQKDEFLIRWTERTCDQICAAIARQPPGCRGMDLFRRVFDEVDEMRGAALRRLFDLQKITAGSTAAACAILTAQRQWEQEMVAALRAREPELTESADRTCRVSARVALAALQCAFEEWAALPQRKATRAALTAALDKAFDTIEADI